LWGWVNGFPGGHGWNGCLSLPRLLTLSPDGHLRQTSAPQLNKLRGRSFKWQNIPLQDGVRAFELPHTNSMEIRTDIDLENCQQITLAFKCATNGMSPLVMSFSNSKFKIMDTESPLLLAEKGRTLQLRIFVDRSVVEVFIRNEICVTKLINPLAGDQTLEISAAGRAAKARLVEVWPMKTIWGK
jgi:beta-fructofuranosidase